MDNNLYIMNLYIMNETKMIINVYYIIYFIQLISRR